SPAVNAEPPFDPQAVTPDLYIAMAQMSHRGGNVAYARSLYQKALAKDPRSLEALLGAARMEDREGNLDVAISLYRRAVQAHAGSATALNDLGLCLARRGDMQGAQQALQQAIRMAPQKPLYRNNLAKVLVESNQLDAATNHLLAVNPPAAARYNMAVLLAERGRLAESQGYLRAALAIDPNLAPAQQMLALQTSPSAAPATAAAPAAVAQTSRSPSASPNDASESILPTPQIVATIPWRAPDEVDAAAQPVLPANAPGGASSPAQLPPTE
ncbi:MAG: tetratricopeptide repeat protein, partial [Pirellulales bacterium]|nr:tetratricopeptide repeat protein [Pirellulales bacterium]